jgi:hypothetical protein
MPPKVAPQAATDGHARRACAVSDPTCRTSQSGGIFLLTVFCNTSPTKRARPAKPACTLDGDCLRD